MVDRDAAFLRAEAEDRALTLGVDTAVAGFAHHSTLSSGAIIKCHREDITMDPRGRRLLWHGMLLFVLGLVTGLFSQQLGNPRMGLAAHLEGVMNGIFLLALGGAWNHVRLSTRAAALAFGAALYGTYANWTTTLLAALFGTAAMTPIASGAHKGLAWQELLVTFGFVSVALAMLTSSCILLLGFRRFADGEKPDET
jgi:hydroxylaminobenzene mutase